MIKCDKCDSDLRKCPVCGVKLCQDVHGTWYHSIDRRCSEKKCPFEKEHLNDEQLEYLAKTNPKFEQKQWTACQFCLNFVGHLDPNREAKPCKLGNEIEGALLHALARMDRCPMYERK